MPKLSSSTLPEGLRVYHNLGVQINYQKGEEQIYTDCPFCGREKKFSIEAETSKFRCLVCSTGNEKGGGNSVVFVRRWLDHCFEETTDYSPLLNSRKGITEETLMKWNVAYNELTDEWLIPGYTVTGSIGTVYRYRPGGLVMATATLGHQLFGLNVLSHTKSVERLYVCEGPWDAMAVYQVLDRDKEAVIGVPGCGTFLDKWVEAELFQQHNLAICYDSDHPVKRRGKVIPPGGYEGVKRVTKLLTAGGMDRKSISYLKWGKDGYDPELPSGHDLRDALYGDPKVNPDEAFEELKKKIATVPLSWVKEPKTVKEPKDLQCLKCESYEELVTAWKEAMQWTYGLDKGLSVMLAAALTTKLIGEQLWFKIIGPASSGKTTLLEGLAVAKQHVFSKDTIRGFYSGMASKKGTDSSLAALAKYKTLAIKDGDTLLKQPNLTQILSEARGLYDGAGRTHYRNSVMHDYEGHRMSFLLCGTKAIKKLDDSDLGTRFLDCILMDEIDEDFEYSVALKAAEQESRNALVQSNGMPELRYDPSLAKAMQLTGGYVTYLRKNDVQLMSGVSVDETVTVRCAKLGMLISKMRARPGRRRIGDDEEATREFSPRLVKQLIKLTMGLTAVRNKTKPDSAIMDLVKEVAIDTARGVTFDLTMLMYEKGDDGLTTTSMKILADHSEGTVMRMLKFMRKLNMVTIIDDPVRHSKKRTMRPGLKWKLTRSMTRLLKDILEE